MFLLILLALLGYAIYQQFIGKRKGLPPGPTPLPVIGNLGAALRDVDALNQMPNRINRWCQQYGGICTVWIPDAQVMISDYSLMKELFVTKGNTVVGRPTNYMMETIFLNAGLAFSEGRVWQEQRRFVLHVLRDFGLGRGIMEEKINIDIDRLMVYLNQKVGNQSVLLDPSWALSVTIGSIISNLVCNYRYHFDNDPDFERFVQLNTRLLEGLQSLNSMMVSQYPWLLNFPAAKRSWDNDMEAYEFCKKNLEQDGSAEPTCYTEAFIMEMHRRAKSGEPEDSFNETQLYMAVMDLWTGGMETTVHTIRWALLYITLWPQVQEKLVAEIQSALGGRRVEMSDKSALPYMNATILEVQRYANVLPVNLPHKVVVPNVEVGGHVLTAGTTVTAQMSAVHMTEEHFDSPEEFRPERFLEPPPKPGLNSPEKVMPFSFGKRACPGESLARMELFLIFTTLVQNFRFSFERPDEVELKRLMLGNWQLTRVPGAFQLSVEKRPARK